MDRPRHLTYPDGKIGRILWRRSVKVDGKEKWGYADTIKRTILIGSTAGRRKAAEVLLHEILHQCESPVHPADGLDETTVETLATNLAEVWKRNPDVMLWIHEGLTGEEA